MNRKEQAIELITDYIRLYKEDIPFLKTEMEISLNNRTIKEFEHIKRVLERVEND